MKIYSYKNLLRVFFPCIFLPLFIYSIIYSNSWIFKTIVCGLGILLIIYNLILNKRFMNCYIYFYDDYMELCIMKYAYSKIRLFENLDLTCHKRTAYKVAKKVCAKIYYKDITDFGYNIDLKCTLPDYYPFYRRIHRYRKDIVIISKNIKRYIPCSQFSKRQMEIIYGELEKKMKKR